MPFHTSAIGSLPLISVMGGMELILNSTTSANRMRETMISLA